MDSNEESLNTKKDEALTDGKDIDLRRKPGYVVKLTKETKYNNS